MSDGPPEEDEVARRYRALFENMSEGFVICEAIRGDDGKLCDYWIRAANPVFVRRAPEGRSMVGRRQEQIRPGTFPAWYAACGRALAGRDVRFEYFDRRAERWYDVHMMRLSDTEFGQFFVDVTERKAAEARQAALFDELNHRVKNNLAVVSSILELQARGSTPTVREPLEKAVDRIRAIADLHSMLYQQASRDMVAAPAYLENLCRRLETSLFEDGRVRVTAQAAAVSVPVGEAVSLGLIVNELVTNAAKHAFADGAGGTVAVRLAASDGGLVVSVTDNGRGMAREMAAALAGGAGGGLGLRIVRSLAGGLGGEVRVTDGEGCGTEVEVVLPLAAVSGA